MVGVEVRGAGARSAFDNEKIKEDCGYLLEFLDLCLCPSLYPFGSKVFLWQGYGTSPIRYSKPSQSLFFSDLRRFGQSIFTIIAQENILLTLCLAVQGPLVFLSQILLENCHQDHVELCFDLFAKACLITLFPLQLSL